MGVTKQRRSRKIGDVIRADHFDTSLTMQHILSPAKVGSAPTQQKKARAAAKRAKKARRKNR